MSDSPVTIDGQDYVFPPENKQNQDQEKEEIIWPPQGENPK